MGILGAISNRLCELLAIGTVCGNFEFNSLRGFGKLFFVTKHELYFNTNFRVARKANIFV